MSDQDTWEAFVVGLCDLAVKYDAEAYLRESTVILAARAIQSADQSGRITVTRFDDEAARVETGWCFSMVVDYVSEVRDRPVPALGLVEAICSGNAEEQCLIDADGEWVGVFSDAWSMTGTRWQAGSPGSLDSLERRAVRRFPKWGER